ESGYPYMVFEDHVNDANPIKGRISMSKLCSEILQVSDPSTYNADLSYDHVGKDISCNLGSMNIAKTMDSEDFGGSVETAVRALTSVSDLSDISSVPRTAHGDSPSHVSGERLVELHGCLAHEHVSSRSEEGIVFTDRHFHPLRVQPCRASDRSPMERKKRMCG